jgi:hypothetical protein
MEKLITVFIILCMVIFITGCEIVEDDEETESLLNISQSEFYMDIIKGKSETEYLTLINPNIEEVSWSVSSAESWVTFFPESGILTEDENIIIKIIVNTTGIDAGFHDGAITVDSENTDSETLQNTINISVFAGNYEKGTYLTADKTLEGFIMLGGDLVIASGVTLTVLPGTVIKTVTERLDWEYTLYPGGANSLVDIIVFGELIAEGTAQDNIVITAAGENPEPGSWFGIHKDENMSDVSIKYVCLKYPKYGMFIYSKNSTPPVIQNCMFAYCKNGCITDGGPDSSYSFLTFVNSDFGFRRLQDNTHTDLNNCVFYNNRLVDVSINPEDSTSITITNSNFIDPDNIIRYNLYISDLGAVNSTITAENCYGIKRTFVNGATNNIYVNDPSSTEISGSGCGFPMP